MASTELEKEPKLPSEEQEPPAAEEKSVESDDWADLETLAPIAVAEEESMGEIVERTILVAGIPGSDDLLRKWAPVLHLNGPEVVVTWLNGAACQPLHIGACWPTYAGGKYSLSEPYSQVSTKALALQTRRTKAFVPTLSKVAAVRRSMKCVKLAVPSALSPPQALGPPTT
jgi:hypothetical protein